MNKRSRYIAALLVVGAGALPVQHASAFCRMTTMGGAQIGEEACVEEGEPLKWEVPCLSYSIDERASRSMSLSEVEEAVRASFDAWQNQTCNGGSTNLIFQQTESSQCQRAEFREFAGANVNTIAFLDPWQDPCGDPYAPNAFAITNVWFNMRTGQMLDADMLINDTLGPYDNCPETGCPEGRLGVPIAADLANLVTHEAGHFIGIGHSDVEEATMFASAPRGEISKRTLAQDDINAVCTIYPPGGLTPECDSEPIGGLDLNCEDDGPAACACAEDDTTVNCIGGPGSSNGGGCSAGGLRRADAVSLALFVGLLVFMARKRRRHSA